MLRVVQSDKLSFKRQGIDLLVIPCLLNDKLSLWVARSVDRPAVRQNGGTSRAK